MRMRGRDHIRSRRMHLRMNCESGDIDGTLPVHDLAAMIHENEIRDANLAEMHPKRIDPEMFRPFRIAGRDVAGNAFIVSEFREQPERRSEPLLAMAPFLFRAGKLGRTG